jgi:hypothetical protein
VFPDSTRLSGRLGRRPPQAAAAGGPVLPDARSPEWNAIHSRMILKQTQEINASNDVRP